MNSLIAISFSPFICYPHTCIRTLFLFLSLNYLNTHSLTLCLFSFFFLSLLPTRSYTVSPYLSVTLLRTCTLSLYLPLSVPLTHKHSLFLSFPLSCSPTNTHSVSLPFEYFIFKANRFFSFPIKLFHFNIPVEQFSYARVTRFQILAKLISY